MNPSPQSESPGPELLGFRLKLIRAENAVMAAILLVMMVLPVAEILLRKVASRGIPGSMSIVQHLTLWVAFLGALLATREHGHLSLSTSELLKGKARAVAKIYTNTVAASVTMFLAYASLVLVEADSGGDQRVVGFVKAWWSETVMPVGLGLVSLRMIFYASPRWTGRAIALVGVFASLGLSAFAESPEVVVWPLTFLIFSALLLGAPIFVAMSGLAMMLFFKDGVPIASVPAETVRLVVSPTLPAIPLLTLAGYVLGEGGAAKRLLRVSRALFGTVPGGLAIMVCLVCAVFTTFTGGSGVTILALGGLMLPILTADKYPEGFSLGLVTASGSLGLLFPPSLPVILYSVVAQIGDLNSLYVAGMVPGALMIGMVCAYGMFVGIREKTPKAAFSAAEAKAALFEAKWELLLPIVVAVLILGGLATIVEAAAVAAVYALVVEVFVFKDIPVQNLGATMSRAATLVGAVLIVLGVALGLTSYLVDAELPAAVIAWVKAHIETQHGFLLMLNVLLLVLGSVFEIYAAIVILAPLVAPLGAAYGVDPIHLAIVFLANLELGFLFPPMGLNLFLSSTRFHKPLPALWRHAFPFLCIMAVSVLLITYLPAMTIGVLDLFGMRH